MPGSRARFIASAVAMLTVALFSATCAPRKPAERWQAVEVPTQAEFRGIWFTDSLNGWVMGGGYLIEGGIVGRTRDGGRTWEFRSGILPGGDRGYSLSRVQFRDTLRGVALGGTGIVLITDDGGATWRNVRYGRSTGDGLSDLQFLDESNAWAIGPASIVRSVDGGETWGALVYSSSENGYLSGNAIHFIDGSRGWLAGHSGRFMRSDDGGISWTAVPLPLPKGERPILWDVTFVDAMNGWVVGEQGMIFHTTDGGTTWARQETGVPIVRVPRKGEPPRPREPIPELEMPPDRLTVSSVRFLDPHRGWAAGYYADVAESVILGTADGGATWSVERVQPGELLRSIFAIDSTHVWVSGDRARTTPQVILRYVGS